MKFQYLFLIGFILSLSAAQESKNGVFKLTGDNFEEFIKSHNHVLVKFYAPWCQQSQKLAPEYEKAAATLASDNIVLAEVDCSQETNLAQGLMIENYPTMLYFRKQHLIDYNGGRTQKEIETWCKKKLLPPVTMVNTYDSVGKYLEDQKKVLVIYFGELRDEAYKEFEETVHLFNNDNLILDIPYVILLKSFDEKRIDYKGQIHSESMRKFINANMHPRVVKLSDVTADHVFGDNKPGFFLYLKNFSALTEKEQIAIKEFNECAKDIKQELMMSECDLSNEVCSKLAEFTGISTYSTPILQILDPRGATIKKYILQEGITQDQIKKFAEQFEQGSLKPFLKSQEIPQQNTNKRIKQLVGKNFEEEVINKPENFIVKFYAEWCTQSQQFKPIFEQFAELMAEEKNLIFAEIEGSENEVPGIEIDFFPTIMLFQSENKSNPIIFKGERTIAQLAAFINQHINVKKETNEKLKEKSDL